ncbi:hypothetical protein BCU24_00675 [Vibrio cyclitrophicus]|uniref:hypothetical protein n=1 Tax=Vibrio cyclitrophicus TaxID=47951 RepID=UPI000CA97BC1|nr:hypothetical protein [Vibrio cyclitrophicus]PMJ43117.1 hypothetical protein BCU24_00675 [Vibrio cyclitrophicus]
MNNTMMIQETHNALVLEYVLDTNGFTSEEPCPCCGQAAVRREFDELLGGCINRVYSLDCTHCDHHECDQEFCSKCEANMEGNKRGYSKACYYADVFDVIEQKIRDGNAKAITGVHWTELKQALHSEPDVVSWLCTFYLLDADEPQAVVHWWKKTMLDARFNARLEARIEQAKLN